MHRNDIFYTAVDVGDEIVGYTSIPEAMEQSAAEFTSQCVRARGPEQTVYKLHLNPDSLQISQSNSLFSQLVDSIQNYFLIRCSEAQSNEFTGSFGDDCTLASMTIPSPELQSHLSKIEVIRVATVNYLAWMNENTQGYRGLTRFSHFYHSDSGKKRAQNLLEKIEDNDSYESICEAVINAFDNSGKRQHSYSRYLVKALSSNKVLGGGVSDKDFTALKAGFNLREVLNSAPATTLHLT